MLNFARFRRFSAHLTAAILLLVAARPASAEPGLAMYQIGPGWATFGLALPRGAAAAANGVRVGTLPTQTDVKTTWDDGSIRFAVVTTNGGAALNPSHYPILPAVAPQALAPLTPAWPTASVSFNVGGTTYVADLPEAATADRWLSGPLVVESRAYVTPTAGGAAHPVLRVIFDVRSYIGGGHRVDVTVENALDVIQGEAFTYDVVVTVNGAEVFSRSALEHGYLARWRQAFATGGLVEADVVPDFGPYFRSNALPPYLPSIDAPALSTDGAGFDILQPGAVMVPMNAHGGRAELAPYPDWAAQYIVHKRASQRDFVLKHGELAGSWGIHIKNPDGVSMISIDDRPDFWLWFPDENSPNEDRPANGLRGLGLRADIAHQPSLAYIPYLVTGDRFFLDEVKYWANFTLLGTYQDTNSGRRGGSLGLLEPNEVRGIGWGLRNIVDAAIVTPDDDPMKGYFAQKVRNNLNWLDTVASNTTSPSPLGFMFTNRRPEDGFAGWTPYAWVSMWEQAYVGWAVDHAIRQGLSTGTPKIGTRFRDRLATTQLKLMTTAGFPRDWAGSYVFAVGRHSTTPVGASDVITYFNDVSQVFSATSSPICEGAPCNQRPFEGYYGPEVRLMLMVARGFGGANGSLAQQAYNYVMSHQQIGSGTMLQDLNRRSGWAISLGGVNPLPGDAAPARPANLQITTTNP
jgi:hypothetical protein